jgi:hypothetical protein
MGGRAGNSIFFSVKRIEDPIGLLPAKLILGINKVSLTIGKLFWSCTMSAKTRALSACRTLEEKHVGLADCQEEPCPGMGAAFPKHPLIAQCAEGLKRKA